MLTAAIVFTVTYVVVALGHFPGLEVAETLRVRPMPYLLALATASNIGSVATLTGNPQNMLAG